MQSTDDWNSSETIQNEIKAAFGFIPTFFEPAFEHPTVLQNLWEQTRLSYLVNPLPSLFKEKVAALLSRFCAVSYCLHAHSSWLRELGMKPAEILELLERDVLEFDAINENIKWIGNKPIDTWPESGSQLESSLFSCCVSIFIDHEPTRVYAKLRALLGERWYNHVVELIAWKRMSVNWIESHPEISAQTDERVKRHLAAICEEEPRMREYLDNYRGRIGEQINQIGLTPMRETKKHVMREKQVSQRLRASLEKFENVSSALNLGSVSCDLTNVESRVEQIFRNHSLEILNREQVVESVVSKCRQAIVTGEILRLRVGAVYLIGWATYCNENRPESFELITFDSAHLPDHKFGSVISMD